MKREPFSTPRAWKGLQTRIRKANAGTTPDRGTARLTRTSARSIAHRRAQDAGLDVNTRDVVAHRAMEVFDPELTMREWLEFVDQEIQRHAQP
jgi:hypothetical protein